MKEKWCGSSRVPGLWLLFIEHCLILDSPPYWEEKKSRERCTVATQTAAEPQEQSMPVAVTPIQKKKSKTKSVPLVRDEEVQPLQQEAEPKIST